MNRWARCFGSEVNVTIRSRGIGRHAAVEGVLVALVGERADEADLAAHVVALDEQRRSDDEDVDAEPAGELGGLAVDPAVDVDLATERPVAEQVARRRAASSAATSFMNDWPPKPGSTVITSTMSRSSRYGSRADSGVAGLTASPAARPAARMRRSVGSIASSISTWNVIESQPASRYSSRKRPGSSTIRCASNGSSVRRAGA